MSDIKLRDSLGHVRASAQEPRRPIGDAAAKRVGAVKADLEAVSQKAKAGAESVRGFIGGRNGAAKNRLAEAVTHLEATHKHAGEALKSSVRAFQISIPQVLAKARACVQEISEALAAARSARPALATAVGVDVGALLGAMAARAGAAVGAVTAGVVALAADADRADARHEAANKTRSALGAGRSAVIAEVSEDRTAPIDARMRELGGTVYRRAKSEQQDDAWGHECGPGGYPHPYACISKLSFGSRQSSTMFPAERPPWITVIN